MHRSGPKLQSQTPIVRCLPQEDGANPVKTHAQSGTRYSFLQNLDGGSRCCKFRRVDGRDDDGLPVTTRGVFQQVSRGLPGPMNARRQIGARHVAGVRGAFRGGQARLRRRVDQPANPEPAGATRGTQARMAATSTRAKTWHPIRNDKGPDILEVLSEKKPTTPRPSA